MTTPLPKGRHRWLTNPSTVGAPVGVLLGAAYVLSVANFPAGTGTPYAVLVAVVTLLFATTADGFEQRRLRTIRGLSEGALPATEANLIAAAKEAAQAADTTFLLATGCFVAGTVLIAMPWWAWTRAPLDVVIRVGLVGFLVGPLTGMLCTLLVLPRARRLLRELIDAGLPAQMLSHVVPARFELQRRLVLYSAIAVLTPLMLIADAGMQRLDSLLEALRRAPSAEVARQSLEAGQAQSLGGLAVLVVAALLMVVFCGWLSGSVLGEPLKALAAETERLAGGRYQHGRLVMAEDETWAAATAIAAMESHLLDGLEGATTTARGIREAAEELVATGAQQEQGAAEQSAALLATTATTEELARSARQISTNAQRVSEIARATLSTAMAGKASAESFTAAMAEVRRGNQAIADSVVRLNKRVQQVGRIIEFIDGIADKSDLLALNAELEGHKAGAVGQGFGLVAAEMRRLAENVMTSTREIARLIEDIRDATNAAVMATEAGVKATDVGASLATKVSEALARIVDFANLSADAMQSISLATVQQQAGSDQLVSAMADINRSTSANLDGVRGMSRAQGELVTVSRELEQVVTVFGGGRS